MRFSSTILSPQPSFANGYAPRNGPPKYLHLWNGLVGAWHPTLGATGNTLRDQSLYGKHGTLINGATWTQSQLGWVINLNGANQWVDCGTLQQIGTANDSGRSFLTWFRLTTTAWREAMISVGGNQYVGQFQWWNHAIRGPIFAIKDGGGTNRYLWWNPHTVVAKRWYCGVVVVKPPVMTMYFDGKVVASNSIMVGGFNAATPTCWLGTDNATGSPFNGRLGPCAIWNRAITPSEVQCLYKDPFALLKIQQTMRFLNYYPRTYVVS